MPPACGSVNEPPGLLDRNQVFTLHHFANPEGRRRRRQAGGSRHYPPCHRSAPCTSLSAHLNEMPRMKTSFVTVVLAGGKGTRMGSSDKHKVCFEVLGIPVIIRALETYNLCGSMLNIVVVGMTAEGVMATVNPRFPCTVYAFQEKPLGTGNAARKAAEILERM